MFRAVLGLQGELPVPAAEGPQRVQPSNHLHPQSPGRRQGEPAHRAPATSAQEGHGLTRSTISAQMVKDVTPEMNASSSEAEEEREEHLKLEGGEDPDFSQVCCDQSHHLTAACRSFSVCRNNPSLDVC